MQIKIYNGNQIGGCVTTIESSKGTRIAIDIGENLPSTKKEKKDDLKIEGLTIEGNKKYDAVFVTHYHGDHIGLFSKVQKGIPIYIGEISKEIFKKVQQRLIKAEKAPEKNLDIIENFITYKIPEKIKINDILVTPIEVDHSAFNAHMLLIECDGEKILHTGDFRIHGPRGKAVIPALKKYVGKVDYLICEGTTLSRNRELPLTEFELKDKAEEIFRQNKNVFVLCSSTNIDRIAVLYKAALKSKKIFICDDYQKDILQYIDSISKSNLYKFKKVYSYALNLLNIMNEKGFVMLIRDNFLSRKMINNFPDNCFVYSQWEGYLNKEFEEYKSLQELVPENHIYLHTSGHAYFEAIKQVCEIVKPKILIPIHGENPEKFEEMNLENCEIKYFYFDK